MGINIRTAEILTGTKTFQKAKTCIYNTDGMPVYVDIPTEYGKTWLKDLVTGNASICLELDQELITIQEKLRMCCSSDFLIVTATHPFLLL